MNHIERDYLMQQANDLVTDFLQGQSGEIVQALIERVEELERELREAFTWSRHSEAKLQRYRELAEMQKEQHGFQCLPYKVTFEECTDPMCVKARELLKED